MRRLLIWILAAAAVAVLAIGAVGCGSGDDDGSAETVSAADWAENLCGAVGVWRDEMDAIAADVGTQTEASVRSGLERALEQTELIVDAIDAGVPDTENGDEAAEQVSSWANGAINDLNQAQSALDSETGGDVADELRLATSTIEGVVESGRQVLADIAITDPELAEAIRDSDTCQEVQPGAGG